MGCRAAPGAQLLLGLVGLCFALGEARSLGDGAAGGHRAEATLHLIRCKMLCESGAMVPQAVNAGGGSTVVGLSQNSKPCT